MRQDISVKRIAVAVLSAVIVTGIIYAVNQRGKIARVFTSLNIKDILNKFAGKPISQIPPTDQPPAVVKALPMASKNIKDFFAVTPVEKIWGIDQLYKLPVDTLRQSEIKAVASSPADFIAKIKPGLIKASQGKVKDPRWVAAQLALESGWGKNAIGGWNLGGHIATPSWISGGGKYTLARTTEDAGTRTVRPFRAFDTLEEFLNFHFNLIGNKRYQVGLADSIDNFGKRLQDGGYATAKDKEGKLIYAGLIKSAYQKVLGLW
jgi:hypothetical protein